MTQTFMNRRFAAPKRSSEATTMLVQTESSPSVATRRASTPPGLRMSSESALVSSR